MSHIWMKDERNKESELAQPVVIDIIVPQIFEASILNGCKALPLAVRGWAELIERRLCGTQVVLSWDQSVLWIESEGIPVAVMVWQFQTHNLEVWISLSYVEPGSRNKGLFSALYRRIVEIAIEKGAQRIAGGINGSNHGMMAAASSLGRSADYVVYSQVVPPRRIYDPS